MFVDQVRKTAKSTSTLKLTDTSTHSNTPNLPKQIKKKRVNINEEKPKVVAKCIVVLDKPKSPKRPLIEDPFALYVSHQLKGLDKRDVLLPKKK